MTEISIEDFCIALYCAYTRFDSVAPDAAGQIDFTARALSTDREDYYHVECAGVREFAFRSEVKDPK